MTSDDIKIRIYENHIPPFVETELERLYAHIYSTLQQLMINDSIEENTSTYVAERNGTAIALFLLRFEKDKVHVLNEQIEIGIEEIDRFTRHILSTYPDISMICFNAIRTTQNFSAYPTQRFYCTEDIVLDLPANADDYLAQLGKATRKTINYRMNRLKRNFPLLRCEVSLADDVNEAHVHQIIALNRVRMAGKSKVSSLDQRESERLLRLAKWRGLVLVMTIDGRVCAGTICCRIGDNYFAQVIAHDPMYDSFRLGTLCAYLTICECIRRGGREFHFLWGRYDYKYLLLGVDRELCRLTIYRSYPHLLLHGRTALRIAAAGYLQHLKALLLASARAQENGGLGARLSFTALKWLRSVKQLASGSFMQRR